MVLEGLSNADLKTIATSHLNPRLVVTRSDFVSAGYSTAETNEIIPKGKTAVRVSDLIHLIGHPVARGVLIYRA